MKQALNGTILAIAILFAVTTASYAQSKDAAENKRIVESKNFVFKAQTAFPTAGRSLFLTSDYDLTVSGDTITAYLPYFGRAFSVPYNGEGGIKFTSTKSEYNVAEKKQSWVITIKPRDVSEIQQLFLDIYDNGTASLRVTSTNRQPISFNGYIIEGKAKQKRAF